MKAQIYLILKRRAFSGNARTLRLQSGGLPENERPNFLRPRLKAFLQTQTTPAKETFCKTFFKTCSITCAIISVILHLFVILHPNHKTAGCRSKMQSLANLKSIRIIKNIKL